MHHLHSNLAVGADVERFGGGFGGVKLAEPVAFEVDGVDEDKTSESVKGVRGD